ncbi:MAG TPA: PAS domain S-box protein [Spirochaetota bacterium]|nr:PAS domain S-box protein [Spirochaetota bacterium]
MKLNNGIKLFFKKHTSYDSLNSNASLMEYMTRMLLFFLSLVSVPFSLISVIGWFYGFIPSDTVFILLGMSFLFITGLLFVNRGYWSIGGFFPPLIIFISAIYGNIIGGIDAPAMLLYVLAILLVAVLRGLRMMYAALVISLLSYISIGLLHRYGYLKQMRTGETAFTNRIVVVVSVIIGISLLIRFLIQQYRKALRDERAELEERKSFEAALRESEKKYRELVENANSIIIRLNRHGEIIFCNDFGERFFGYSSGELTGRKIVETIIPETDSEGRNLHELIDEIMNSPDDYQSNENENITRDGRRVWINWANKPILDDKGSFVELLCIGNDITEQKLVMEEKEKMQAQLIHAQKMEAVGTLTSGLAHDFNNILGGIMGSLSLLELLIGSEKLSRMDDAKKYIHLALDSSKRASDMIKKLLVLTRREEIKLASVDINESIRNVIEICRNSFPKSILIDAGYSNRPMYAMADPILIEQIFLNICVNASHAMTIMREAGEKEGGTLIVRVFIIARDSAGFTGHHLSPEHASYIVVEIEDSGVGMDSDTRERIFEPFFTMKKKESGTGLGLSLAYSIINQLGGGIEIESEVNKGSLFRILLPELEGLPAENADGAGDDNLVKGHGTILVIDDEISILAIAEDTLSACGYTVMKALDGIQGLSLYRENMDEIDAVLLDISMPFMSGFEVFDSLKEINSSVPVLINSGYNDDVRLSGALSRDNAAFLQKPYTAVELSRAISDLLKLKD